MDTHIPPFKFRPGRRRPRTADRDVLIALDYWTRRWRDIPSTEALAVVADSWVVRPETVRRCRRLYRGMCEAAVEGAQRHAAREGQVADRLAVIEGFAHELTWRASFYRKYAVTDLLRTAAELLERAERLMK